MSNVTVSDITCHREWLKASGATGCITGQPPPSRLYDFFGFRDIKIWYRDATGRMNGDEGFDPKNPMCFCFDCRSTFDPSGTIDCELVNAGDKRACEAYAPLLKNYTNTEDIPLFRTDCQQGWCDPCIGPPIKRQGSETYNGVTYHMDGTATSCYSPPLPPLSIPTLSATHFDEIPTSLPAPRHRDIMNETTEERIKNDLARFRGDIQNELVFIMDTRRGIFTDGSGKDELLDYLNEKEVSLQNKLDAINILLKDL